MNSLSSREVILNSVSVPRIHYYCRLYTIYSSSISQSHYEFISPESTFSRPNYKFAFSFTNSLSISRIHYQYAINFSNSIWIQFQFREFAIYFVSIPWLHYTQCTVKLRPNFQKIAQHKCTANEKRNLSEHDEIFSSSAFCHCYRTQKGSKCRKKYQSRF